MPDPTLAEPGVSACSPRLSSGVTVLVLLSLGHFFVDLYSGALGALQPVFVERLSLSLTQAGILGGVFIFSSSVMQLTWGLLSDRIRSRMFAVAGPAVAAVCISSLGLAPGYSWLLVLAVVGGSGVAAFHPQASSAVAAGSAHRRAGWMAVFISAGTLGFSLGPTYFSQILELFGPLHLYWAAVPGVIMAGLLTATLPAPVRPVQPATGRVQIEALVSVWKPLTILYFLVFIRSILQVVFAQFLPLYLHLERGLPLSTANYTLSFYLASGALGGFLGGHLSDRLGGKTVILISMAGCLPFLAMFFLGSGALAAASLAAGGLILFFTVPVNIVMAQELVPSQGGTVSALMMGFAWGMAGVISIPLVGWASDLFSMHQVLFSLLVFPIVGFALALKLRTS